MRALALALGPRWIGFRAMDFSGYKERVAYHLERLGVESRPTEAAFIDAWNSQIPAKKLAQRHARMSRRSAATDDPNPTATPD